LTPSLGVTAYFRNNGIYPKGLFAFQICCGVVVLTIPFTIEFTTLEKISGVVGGCVGYCAAPFVTALFIEGTFRSWLISTLVPISTPELFGEIVLGTICATLISTVVFALIHSVVKIKKSKY